MPELADRAVSADEGRRFAGKIVQRGSGAERAACRLLLLEEHLERMLHLPRRGESLRRIAPHRRFHDAHQRCGKPGASRRERNRLSGTVLVREFLDAARLERILGRDEPVDQDTERIEVRRCPRILAQQDFGSHHQRRAGNAVLRIL